MVALWRLILGLTCGGIFYLFAKMMVEQINLGLKDDGGADLFG